MTGRLPALGLALALTACSGGEPPAEPVAPAPVAAPAPAPRPAVPDLPEDVGPAKARAGYDLGGPLTCLPLAVGRRCVGRQAALEDACAKAGGESFRCVDCATACSVEPKHRR